MKTENTTELAKEINKNSPKRIGSKTNWSSVAKSNTVDAFAEGTNNNSIDTLNSPDLKSNENSNFNENKIEIFETLENDREETVIERLRRSLVERSSHVGEQVPSSQRFNRHPNLSYEERQKQLNRTMQPGNTSQNLGTAMNKRLDKFESPSSRETSKRSYVSVFSDCDDTQNLETNGSNGNREQNFKGDSVGEKDLSRLQEIENLQNDKNAFNVRIRDGDKSQSSIEKGKEDKNYINIRDHQKSVENFKMSPDIPEYDPNKIPYVEVPDYSDIREERLDEEDRKENEREKIEGETDFIDPEESPEKEPSNDDSSEETLEIKPSKNSRENSSEENNSSLNSNELDKSKANESNSNVLNLRKVSNAERFDEDKSDESDSDLTNLNAGQRDRNDENKSLESLEFGQNSESSMDLDESFEFFELEKEDERKLVPGKGSKDRLNNAKLLKEQESEETWREDSTRARQGDSESESGSVIFDTNEYRKPFDLDEFLKDDPIMKKLNLLEKETRTKYGENGKRVPSGFNESESDNTTTFRIRENETLRDTFDDLPKSYESSNFADTFARIDERIRDEEEDRDDDFTRIFRDFGRRKGHYNRDEEIKNEREKEKKNKDSNEENSDEDFLKFNFKGDKGDKMEKKKGYKTEKKRNRNVDDFSDFSRIFKRFEKDVPSGFGNEDIGNLHKVNTNNVKNYGTKNTRRKEDTRDESQVSRLYDDQTSIKDRDAIYRNFWSLEHKSPVTRVDMEAQERRK